MADPRGFLEVGRAAPPLRPVAERVHDYQLVHAPLPLAAVRAQASRCMDCGVPFCHTGCPVANVIPDWNDLVHRGEWRRAYERLASTNNFPEFTGLLCPAPCEAACVLAINDDAVTIKEIELAIVERAFARGWVRPRPPVRLSGRRVAIVGSGPAGLAAAQELRRAGHEVSVFERDDAAGGLLRYGIPDYKLEKRLVDRRVGQLVAEGVEVCTGVEAGVSPTVAELTGAFDAVVLAVGAPAGRELSVPGRSLAGTHLAMDYLVQQNRRVAGRPVAGAPISARDKAVVILGAGDTSADCLGNAHRERARSVTLLARGATPPTMAAPGSWPDWPFLLRTYPAHEEGGTRSWEVLVTGLSGRGGHVRRMHVARAVRDGGGTFRAEPGSASTIDADLVLLALGFTGPVRDRLLSEVGVTMTAAGTIAADDGLRTSVPGVFVAGDAHRGADLIVTAISDGRRAARSVDAALCGA